MAAVINERAEARAGEERVDNPGFDDVVEGLACDGVVDGVAVGCVAGPADLAGGPRTGAGPLCGIGVDLAEVEVFLTGSVCTVFGVATVVEPKRLERPSTNANLFSVARRARSMPCTSFQSLLQREVFPLLHAEALFV